MAIDAPHLLVVEDDRRLLDLITRYLTGEGFIVAAAGDAEAAWSQLQSMTFDLLILDIMLPKESGLQLTERLRQRSAVPILLLSAKGEPDDRIAGLQVGADDYLAKPFEPRELVLRINAILRRAKAEAGPRDADIHRFGAFSFHAERGELLEGERHVYLTEGETAMLAALAAAAPEPVSREALAASTEAGSIRSIDVQMTRLRRKIERDPRFPRYLQTVRGIGYCLVLD